MPGESVEKYITALYQLVETCEYSLFKEEMLRDRLVVGIKDVALSELLQMDPKLTLKKPNPTVCQEVVQEQLQLLQAKPDG